MTAAEATSYQRVREHLAYLRLTTAAEHLSAELDRALKEQLSATHVLERLLEVEVEETKARRQRGRLRYARYPVHKPWPSSTSTSSPRSTASSWPSSPRFASWRRSAMSSCSGRPVWARRICENHPAGLAWPTMLAMAAARMTRRSHWPVAGALALDMSPRLLSAPAWPPRVGLIRSLSASA